MAVETYECIISGTLSGQFVQNVLHFNLDNTATTNSFTVSEAIIQKMDVSGGFLAKWVACLPIDYTITSVRCRRILSTGGPTAIKLSGELTNINGARSGLAMTSSNAPLVIWLTSLRPSKTGRVFMPGVSVDDCASNVLVPALVTALQAMAAIFRDGFTPTSPAYLTQGAVLRRSLSTADDVTNVRVSPIIGNQRRRQRPI